MAKVYYVKDGSSPQNCVDPFGRRISLHELERRIQGQAVRYLGKLPPDFNPDQPSSSPQYVVVEAELDEPLGRVFTQTGFYVLPQLSTDEAETRIFPPA
jgi:hypothetical protein